MERRAQYFWLVVSALTALVCGCAQTDRYEIVMKPEGQNLQRELTCWREEIYENKVRVRRLPVKELERISQLYQSQVTEPDAKKQTFVGTFTGKTPNDIGGSGLYVRFVNRMGTVSGYVERFLGTDELAEAATKRLQFSDQLVDLLIDWLQTELGESPQFEKLREFCDEELRRDIKNMAIYFWLAGIVSEYEEEIYPEVFISMGQYLAERGYFAPEEVPVIVSAFNYAGSRGDTAKIMSLIQSFVADKMELSGRQPLPESLAFLSDAQLCLESLRKYLRTTDVFLTRLEEWEEARKANSKAREPKPEDVLNELILNVLGDEIDIFDHQVGINIKLACPLNPFATNGVWDEEDSMVVWAGRVEKDKDKLPFFCYAFWSSPDRGFQEKHFGKVVLEEEALAEYCLWRNGLTGKDAGEWDDFINGLFPGEDLEKRLGDFRFSEDTFPDKSLADDVIELLLRGLENDGGVKSAAESTD